VAKYRITDPAIGLLAQIVHGADVANDLYGRPEAPGLKAIALGFSALGLNDDQEISRGSSSSTTRCTLTAGTRPVRPVLHRPEDQGEVCLMWREFKEFAVRGSVVDLAVGIVIGPRSARSSPRLSTTS